MADLPKLCLEPSRGNEVVGQGSAVLQVLLAVVLYLFRQVIDQNRFVVIGLHLLGFAEVRVLELRRSGGRRVYPLAVYEEEAPVEDRDLVVDRRS